MSHYFVSDTSVESKEILINFTLNNKEISLISDNGVFSKNKIDYGSLVLIKTLLNEPLEGKILDYGAGIGVIGITLNLFFTDLDVSYSEINERALSLIKKNLEKHKLKGYIYKELEEINKFDVCLLNPPIRTGKAQIYDMYQRAYKSLKEKGVFYIVIRKDKGMLSHKTYLESLFKKVSIINKDKGYFILKMTK
jgi:16S rRNA (guanine1207-N2)-methyltransferase